MILRGDNLHKTFRSARRRQGKRPVLDGVYLRVDRGETVGLVGPSGAGKTTLGLILCGLLPPDEGQVWLGEEPVRPASSSARKAVRRRIQIVWQHPEAAFNPRWKLGRSLGEPYRIHGLPVRAGQIDELIHRVHLDKRVLDRRPSEVSGGELQRLAIARAVSLQPDVMILDEPTSMLDAITQAQIIRLLREIQEETGVAYLFISHSVELVQQFSNRVVSLRDGKLTTFRQTVPTST